MFVETFGVFLDVVFISFNMGNNFAMFERILKKSSFHCLSLPARSRSVGKTPISAYNRKYVFFDATVRCIKNPKTCPERQHCTHYATKISSGYHKRSGSYEHLCEIQKEFLQNDFWCHWLWTDFWQFGKGSTFFLENPPTWTSMEHFLLPCSVFGDLCPIQGIEGHQGRNAVF